MRSLFQRRCRAPIYKNKQLTDFHVAKRFFKGQNDYNKAVISGMKYALADDFNALVKRNIRILKSSPYIVEGVNKAIAEAQCSLKSVRISSQQLTDALKSRTRSMSRGGNMKMSDIHAVATLHPKRSRSERTYTLENLRKELHKYPASKMDSELFNVTELPLKGEAPEGEEKKIGYSTMQTLGYAASRLPACYSVAWRIFDELELKLQDFSPKTMLDFGAGPGTSIWAALEVWNCLKSVAAIEPSSSMRNLGIHIQNQRNDSLTKYMEEGGNQVNHNDLGEAQLSNKMTIQWLEHLSGFSKRHSANKGKVSWIQSTEGKTYDLVVASYSWGEVGSVDDKRRALRALWNATADILILIEPGTPFGSMSVREARQMILDWETNDGILNAHVVSPCAHDGLCPMSNKKSSTWCHFSQRFELGFLERNSKIRNNKKIVRNYQDERFSFVVIRRGQRPTNSIAESSINITLKEHLDLLVKKSPYTPKVTKLPKKGYHAEDSDLYTKQTLEKLIRDSIHNNDDDDDEALDDEGGEGLGGDKLLADNEEEEIPSSLQPTLSKKIVKNLGQAKVDELGRASYNWSRIIRPVRKRDSHCLVDVCSAAGPEGCVETFGRLEQFTVSAKDARDLLGTAAVKCVQKLKWGDLFPRPFAECTKCVSVMEPQASKSRVK